MTLTGSRVNRDGGESGGGRSYGGGGGGGGCISDGGWGRGWHHLAAKEKAMILVKSQISLNPNRGGCCRIGN